MRKPVFVSCALALLLSGCPTSFTGSAHVQGGKSGCERKCKANGLRFSGMVFMGEYSTACICELKQPPLSMDAGAPPPAAPPAAPPEPAPLADAGVPQASAATSAAVAMMLQTLPSDQDEGFTLIELGSD